MYGNEKRLETVNEGYAKAKTKGSGSERRSGLACVTRYTSVQFKSGELGQ